MSEAGETKSLKGDIGNQGTTPSKSGDTSNVRKSVSNGRTQTREGWVVSCGATQEHERDQLENPLAFAPFLPQGDHDRVAGYGSMISDDRRPYLEGQLQHGMALETTSATGETEMDVHTDQGVNCGTVTNQCPRECV